ncbi:MAG: methionyl-tRNA formyltransferase, partial [Patescibacteria group bacterium]
MKIVFFGTPDFTLPILSLLHRKFVTGPGNSPIVSVVTQGPKPTGRKKILTYSPVDKWAHERSIPIFHSPQEYLKEGPKADLGLLAAYGALIPKEVIRAFPHGILNVHPSLLPKYRGASPVQATVLTEDVAGVTIIKIDELMDHGPIVSQFEEELNPSDTLETLRSRLFERASEVLVALIEPYLKGRIKPREQNHEEATYTTQVKKDHGFIPPKFLKFALEGKSLDEDWEIGFIKDFSLASSPSSLEKFIRAL